MVEFLVMPAKLATLVHLKTKLFWNKGYVYDVTSKILSRNSNYIVDVVMWSKFGNSSIYTSAAKGLKLKVRKAVQLCKAFIKFNVIRIISQQREIQ